MLVYALGGGAGHLARALAFAARTDPARERVTVLCSPHAPATVRADRLPPHVELRPLRDATADGARAELRAALGGAEEVRLVVDTFPAGLWHELDPAITARASRRTLLRRYVRPGAYAGYVEAAERYDEILVPYHRERSEWDPEDGLAGETHVGPLVRELELASGAEAPLLVLGAGPSELSAAWPPGTQWWSGPLAALPAARAYLALGAGYNTSYELARLGRPFRLVPRERRFDDQFRRADLLGAALHHGAALAPWLAEVA